MALSRALLKGMALTDEQVQAIIDAHSETVNGLKAEISTYKADAEKLPSVQKELDDLKKDGGDWHKKFDDEHKAFEDYKKGVEEKESLNKVKDAYKKLLQGEKVNDKHIDAVMRVTDFSTLKLDDKGNFENEKDLKASIKTDWADFIVKTEDRGAEVDNPPKDGEKKDFPTGRAAQLAKQYHDNLYGATPNKE